MSGYEPLVLAFGDTERAVAGFGVATGWAHEPAHRRGVTDCAMQWLATTPGVSAGWDVGALVSLFWVTGSARSVRFGLSDVLRRVTQQPSVPPFTGTAALPSIDGQLLELRWGLRGFGLASWSRLGLACAAPSDVADVLSRIGRQTTQLFTVNSDLPGDVTPDRDVDHLRDPWTPPLIAAPALIDTSHTFALGWETAAPDPVADALIRRAVDDDGSSTQWLVRRLGPRGAHSALVVQGGLSDDECAAVVAGIRRIVDDGPTQAELAVAIDDAHTLRPQSLHAMVQHATEDALLGSRSWQPPTLERMRRAVADLAEGLLVLAPAGSPAAELATPRVEVRVGAAAGRRYRLQPLINHGPARGTAITVGAGGVSAAWRDGQVSIGRADVVAVETWPSGHLRVTSVHGDQINVDPAEFRGGASMARGITALGAHVEAAYPQPLPPSQRLTKEYLRSGGQAGWLVMTVLTLVPAGLALFFLAGAAFGAGSAGERVGFGAAGVVLAGLSGMLALRAARLSRIARVVGVKV